MGLFSSSKSTSNTTNINDQSVQVGGSIGFTGAQGLAAYTRTLNFGNNSVQGAYSLAQFSSTNATDTVRDTLGFASSSLSNIVNATRDFSQRSIAAGTGQSTPIQSIAGAGDTGTNASKDNTTLFLAIAAVVVTIMLGK